MSRLRMTSVRWTRAPGAAPTKGASARAKRDLPLPESPPTAISIGGAPGARYSNALAR